MYHSDVDSFGKYCGIEFELMRGMMSSKRVFQVNLLIYWFWRTVNVSRNRNNRNAFFFNHNFKFLNGISSGGFWELTVGSATLNKYEQIFTFPCFHFCLGSFLMTALIYHPPNEGFWFFSVILSIFGSVRQHHNASNFARLVWYDLWFMTFKTISPKIFIPYIIMW